MDTTISTTRPEDNAESRLRYIAATAMLCATILAFAPKIHIGPDRTDPYSTTTIIHALSMLGWLGLFCVQTAVVRRGGMHLHRGLGALSSVIVIVALVSGFMVTRRFSAEMNTIHIFLGNMVLLGGFGSLYLLAVIAALKRRIDWHWRLMFLAAFAIMGPIVSRVTHAMHLPGGSAAALHLALICGISIAWDVLHERRLHPATVAGLGIVFVLIGGAATVGLLPPLSDWTRTFVMAALPDAP